MLQYIFIHAEASNTMDRKTIDPIPWTEKHRVQKTCAKIMHKTIGGSAQPNIGPKCLGPHKVGLPVPLKPPVNYVERI